MVTLFKPKAAPVLSAIGLCLALGPLPVSAASVDEVLTTYADIAHAMYDDSLLAAGDLRTAVRALVDDPSPVTLAAARSAWRAARVPYQQSEVYRFGNVLVDDWEGRVNAWPLDEGLIDYVETAAYGFESDENLLYTANVIANPTLNFGGRTVDASEITFDLLQDELHEADNIEANVATGYHAIEFLLWGQDLNGTGPGAGNRPYTDFDVETCTGGHCDRRGDYLVVATDLLIADLEEIVALWAEGGAARTAVLEAGEVGGPSMIVTGLGSLSYGELAGERMQLGLMLHDPEEEHDCFADNTHYSHFYNQVGMQAVYSGAYTRLDGTVVSGPSLSSLVAAADTDLDSGVRALMAATYEEMANLVAVAEGGFAYDQMLGQDSPEGNAVIQSVIDALVAQAAGFEQVVAALELDVSGFEGSDSLDNPDAVFE
ncbi:MAG: peptidase [Alphaproteobacteria bacterium]|jgi:putative iron-regulated protein|nr:peptidase [Alphaproteobacteria bacterium]